MHGSEIPVAKDDFAIKYYFLSDFKRKYELKSPTIIHFFKSRFEYSPDLDIPKDPEPIDCYRGFDPV